MKIPIEDVKDESWRKKIEGSIKNILTLYGLDEKDVKIYRAKLDSKNIFVAATEECDIDVAKELAVKKYSKLPPPITVLLYRSKHVIFIGSNRSLVFLLKNEQPDCVIVKLPDNIPEPKIIKEAKVTLSDVFQGVKR